MLLMGLGLYVLILIPGMLPHEIDSVVGMLAGVTIAHGGVLPNINPVLLPKKTEKVSTKEPKSPSKATKSPKKAV